MSCEYSVYELICKRVSCGQTIWDLGNGEIPVNYSQIIEAIEAHENYHSKDWEESK